MNLRTTARGRPCMVRLPGICDGGGETTVLGHIRMAGITGVGMKAPDCCAAFVCGACHDVLDGRVPSDFEREYLRMAHLEGMARTLNALTGEGYEFKNARRNFYTEGESCTEPMTFPPPPWIK